jgi:hypothetical protein
MQYIKGGGTHRFKKYLFHNNFRNINCLTIFSFKHFEYHNIIQLYQRLFGEENVHVFLYEDFLENNHNFLREFNDRLGFDIDMHDIRYTKVNRSYRLFIYPIALVANRFTEKKMLNKYYIFHIPGWFEFYKKILNRLNRYKIFGKYLNTHDLIRKKYYKLISDYYKESNKILLDKYQLTNIKKHNYPL